MKKLAFAFLLLLLPATAMAADCTPGAVTARQIGNDDYSPADLAQAVVRISLRLVDDCDLRRLTIVPRDSNVFALAGPDTSLQSRQSDAAETIARNISEVELGPAALAQLQDGSEVMFDLLDVDAGQFVRAGNYQMTINILTDDQISGPLLLTMIVTPTLQLVGAAESGNIDVQLGMLDQGASARQSIFFRSNAGVSLMITSDNNGALLHERGAEFGSIAYQARLNGQLINTDGPTVIELPALPGQLTESVFGVDVAPVDVAFSGIYRDVITFDFTAL